MNKLTLKLELELDFKLIGITSPLKDYRLCYYINKFSGLHLSKTTDHETGYASGQVLYFSRYVSVSAMAETEYFLIANRGETGGLLIPEMRGIDYFFMVKNFIDEEDFLLLQQSIARIGEVLAATEVEPQKLKSKENLVF